MIGISTLEASYAHSQNGMLRPDMVAAENVANALNEVIIFRSTGPWSKRWLERGYPSKNFHVKGKSSDWGPHAGLVPFNGVHSKVGYDAAKAAKGTGANKDGLASGFAIKQPLILTGAQIDEQVTRAEGGRTAVQTNHVLQNGDRILLARRSGDGKLVAFRAVKGFGGNGDNFAIWAYSESQGVNLTKLGFDKPTEELEVMASAEIGGQKPMTGDYDLMTICPTWGQYGSRSVAEISKPGIRLPTGQMAGQTFARGVGMDNVLDPSLHTMGNAKTNWNAMNKNRPTQTDPNRREHGDMGNLTPRILRCINALNGAMGATGANSALRRVHHNAESHRNAAFGALSSKDMTTKKEGDSYGDGFPLTAFQPKSVGLQLGTGGNVLTLENLMHFRMYVSRLDELGYYVPRNWLWNMAKNGRA